MEDMLATIAQYEHSCTLLQQRIDEITPRLSGRVPLGPDETVKQLERRRYLLYSELDHMEQAIYQMHSYLRAPRARIAGRSRR